jgi:ABC-type multidrug transport system ATPase subunit/surface polysaccharide O-acyltransferase-like enzyme
MSSSERLHALDAARAFALLAGIVLHATMSFFLPIPAADLSRSTALAVVFHAIHPWRMTLFFLIAGFFAHLAFHRRGARAFAKDRAKRIGVPLVAGWLLLAPATIAIVLWGLARTFPELAAAAGGAPSAEEGLPLTHLWFLYYLAIFYAIVLAVRPAFVAFVDRGGSVRARLDGLVGAGLRTRLAPLALAAPTAAILFLDAGWPLWFGIPTPDTGLAPKPAALVAFGTAFALGWLLHRQAGLLDRLARQWATNLAAAVALTATGLAIVGPTPDLAAPTALGGGTPMRFAYACVYALSVWCWTFGLLGAAVRFASRESAVRRYLADASYWIYLVHLPLVFGMQVLLMEVPLHWAVKFPLIVAVAFAVLLASYHFLVRPTFLGELLNGRRIPRRGELPAARATSAEPASSRIAPAPAAAAVAELAAVTKRYGPTLALDGVDLAVRPGELLAVLGPNGAGKSTAIGLWLGTLQPDSGSVTLLGGSPLEATSRLGVGVMMQEVALSPTLTGRELVALAASCYRDALPVAAALELTGTTGLADRRYGRLSAGQKRQVQLATAICGRPRLLFLDEPSVGLDVAAREAMWRTIRRLRDEGASVVLTTHYLEEAEALADRVAVLAKGRVIAAGSVDEMRALVARRQIRCASTLAADDVRRWPGVVDAVREERLLHVTASDAESVVRRLLAADAALAQLEVRQASLAEAFTELTKEAA